MSDYSIDLLGLDTDGTPKNYERATISDVLHHIADAIDSGNWGDDLPASFGRYARWDLKSF
jgi:hypothetical protein